MRPFLRRGAGQEFPVGPVRFGVSTLGLQRRGPEFVDQSMHVVRHGVPVDIDHLRQEVDAFLELLEHVTASLQVVECIPMIRFYHQLPVEKGQRLLVIARWVYVGQPQPVVGVRVQGIRRRRLAE